MTTSKRHAAREMMPAYPEKGNFGSIIDPFLSGLFRLGAGLSQATVHLDLIRIAEWAYADMFAVAVQFQNQDQFPFIFCWAFLRNNFPNNDNGAWLAAQLDAPRQKF